MSPNQPIPPRPPLNVWTSRNQDRERVEKNQWVDPRPSMLESEEERFRSIRMNPIQEIRILDVSGPTPTEDTVLDQLQLASFSTNLSAVRVHRSGFTYDRVADHPLDSSPYTSLNPSFHSSKSIRCHVEFSKANANQGLQSRSTIQGHQPKLTTEQFNRFLKSFHEFGGFSNALRLKRPPLIKRSEDSR